MSLTATQVAEIRHHIKIEQYDKQAEFHRKVAASRWTGFFGGAGSGKTTAGAQEAAMRAFKYPGTPGLIIAPTFPMLRRVTQRKFLQFIPQEARASFNKSYNHLELVNGTTIDFLSTSNPDHNYGDSVGWIWIDEAALVPKAAFLIFIGRLREGKGEDQRAWATGTPKGFNWCYEQFQTGKADRDGVFEVCSADNPHATEEYLADMRTNYIGPYLEQEYYGRFVKFEGVIYGMIEDATHLLNRPVQEMICFEAAVDWGYDHPWVFGVAGFDSDDRGHLFDALHERGLTLDDQITLVEDMMKRYPIQTIYCPDDRPDNIKSYQNAGFPVTVVKREVISRIQTVAAALKVRDDGRPGFTFSPGTEPVYTECKQYQWKVKPEDKPGKEEPLKVKDDGPDMVGYLLHGRKQAQQATGLDHVIWLGDWDGDEL